MVKEAYCLSDRFCPLSLVGGAGAPGAGSCAGVELGDRVASDCTSVLGFGVGASASGARCVSTRLFLSESKDWEGDGAVLKP